MQQVGSIHAQVPRLSRFGWLMGLYAENHGRMQRLFAPARLQPGSWVSSVGFWMFSAARVAACCVVSDDSPATGWLSFKVMR